jgi:hypothetical protein
MKDLAFLSCILVLAVIGLTFACHITAGESDETPTISSLTPEAP